MQWWFRGWNSLTQKQPSWSISKRKWQLCLLPCFDWKSRRHWVLQAGALFTTDMEAVLYLYVCTCVCMHECVCYRRLWEWCLGTQQWDFKKSSLVLALFTFNRVVLEVLWLHSHMHSMGFQGFMKISLWLHYKGTSLPRDPFIKVSWQCASCLWPCHESTFKQTVHSCNAERVASSTWIKLNIQ